MAVPAPGMATAYSLQTHPATTNNAMFTNSLDHVLRTGRGVTAGVRKEGRNGPLV